MFCPQCSQQQVSNDARFCSRCGFQLEGVSLLLKNGGVLPGSVAEGELGPPSPRLKGVRQGIALWLLGILVMPILILMIEELKVLPEEVGMLAAIMLFVGGFVRIAYAMLLEDGPLRRKRLPPDQTRSNTHTAQVGGAWAARDASALPPGQGIPANAYVPPRADTAEVLQRPPSVTENTTRLLEDEKDKT